MKKKHPNPRALYSIQQILNILFTTGPEMTKIFNRSSEKEKRRILRSRMTEAECFLWKHIRNKNLGGLRFRRQVSIGYYIVDFYCPEKRLAVEVDGEYHNQKEVQKNDTYRAEFLTALGISVVRFSNEEVMNDIDGVCRKISEATPSGAPRHLPLR